MLNKKETEEFLRLRNETIRRDFSHLNDKQTEAVLATEGPLLILAGAGSGKTTVLINRIANLIKYGRAGDTDELPDYLTSNDLEMLRKGGPDAEALCGYGTVEPWRILAITFTNKAASELKSRLERKLGAKAEDIWACTFHSSCVRILRREAERLGYQSNFSIYDTDDSLSLIKRIEKDLDIDSKEYNPKAILGEISAVKNMPMTPAQYREAAEELNDFRKKRYGVVFAEYQRRMFTANAMDFDDLIANTVKILQDFPDARDYWQRRFRYILIDEYQDTNHLQYLLASLLCGNGNICVVGDDDQSIYKFRGANIENILSFESQYANCRTIRLEQNYRSTGHILSAANSVIKNNIGRKGKTLWTKNSTGDPIVFLHTEDEREEAEAVASRILASVEGGSNWNEHAVLYRMNAQSNQFEYALKRRGIPYKIIGGMRFYDRAEIKDILSYMNLIASPSDDLRLMRIVNTPARGIGDRTVETVRALAAENGCSLFEIMQNCEQYPALKKNKAKFDAFTQMILSLKAFSENNPTDAFFDELLEQTGYIRALEEKNTIEDASRIDNIRELKTTILTYMQESGDESLEGFLADVALYTDTDNIEDGQNCGLLMTVHSSKGLEFRYVYLVGMEETIFPGIRAIGMPEEMEEERRLCYVAITRAKEKLYITAARQRMIFGRTQANAVSRFIQEIGDEDIDRNIPDAYSSAKRTPFASYTASRPQPQRNPFPVRKAPETRPAPSASISFKIGDDVSHKAFGEGTITAMKPMGNDFLVEIQFKLKGSKKLMLKAAATYMKKI